MVSNNINFKNFATEPTPASTNRIPGIESLARQSSVFSLTFDEFQNTVGGVGKDFGSMNMDELLKSIWSAEENQTVAPIGGSGGQDGSLQRQGSLALPRTLSQRRVDEVWKELGGSGAPQFQRQQTLGEVTLEEFLARAGVVREDVLTHNNGGSMLGELSQNNGGLGIGFQQNDRGLKLMGMKNLESVNHPIPVQSSSNLPMSINGVRPNQTPSQQLILPKQTAVPFASQVPSAVDSRGGFMGMGNQLMSNNNLVQSGGGMGMVGLVGGPTMANSTTLDAIPRSNVDTSSLSPVPYVFNGSMRGRKSGGVIEKVVERRQKRMIKNRESAARSRARKQAYTMELEAEIAKLKEENEKLQKKQEEIMETEKNQHAEVKNMVGDVNRFCLRRTLTGPW